MTRETRSRPGGGVARSAAAPPPNVLRRSEASDTMQAWERFLTSPCPAAMPERNYVVSSWIRSQQFGIDPCGRAAPIAARGDAIAALRERHATLLDAARDIFGDSADLLAGSRSILLLTSPDGVVLEVAGDPLTLEQGEAIHLVQGGDWREDTVGTNGIGTALATRRPAQVHAAEHFCEGIKSWTCAACPVFEPGTGAVLGVVDISGPPVTYQRTNLTLAVAIARQIESVLVNRVAQEQARLLQACLDRLSTSDARGMIALDRTGRLVHASGQVPTPVPVGQRVPGLDASTAVEAWADLLPQGWRAEWFDPVALDGRTIGALLVVPREARLGAPTRVAMRRGSEADGARSRFEAIVGASAAMQAMVARARQLSAKRVPVLIEGETGVGKELLARAIHGPDDGTRPFVVYNCGAATRELLAGELFGHVRGAFTGATAEGRPGRFELADGGTLCLDEIGEMPLEVQPLLLRALEEGVVYRLGDAQPRHVSVRLLALTNRNLLDEVEAGRFRRDLFYRIGVTRLRIPPLRERDEDVLVLARHFIQTLAARHAVAPRPLSEEAARLLRGHGWPGNVRELRNIIESALLTGAEGVISAEDLAPMLPPEPDLPTAMDRHRAGGPGLDGGPARTLEDAEREAIARAVRSMHGNLTGAARLLGISRSTLYRKVEQYNLPL